MLTPGCYSQVNPKEISLINGIDLIIGSKEKFNMSFKKKIKKEISIFNR